MAVPKTAEGDDKLESQWTPNERRVFVQDQCLKSIIMSCLLDDIIKSVISCEIAKATWTDLVHNFEGLSDTKENRIMDLKLEYQTFKAKSTESLSQTYTRYKTLLNVLANDGVNLSKHEINISMEENSDYEVDKRSSEEYLRDLDIEFHERALLANSKQVSDNDEVTQVKVLMALADDELTVGKNHACIGEWIDITMRKINILLSMDEDANWQNYLKKCLHLLHMDLFEPVSPISINHEKYTLVIVDEYSRTEFRNHELESFCDEKGISQNFSSPYTPEQNGVAERKNRTLIEAARTMLNGSILFKHFWTEVVRITCYTQNRSIIVKRHNKTPYEIFRERIPDISYFHVVFNTRRQQVEKTYHVTFDESMEVIRFTNTSVDEIGIDDSSRYPPDEFIHKDDPYRQYQANYNISYYDRWSKDQHIEFVNILGDPHEGMLIRSMAAKLTAASASECLFADFLSKIEPKKVFEALKDPRWVDAISEFPDYVCKLDKALYGLKQAPRACLMCKISVQSKGITSSFCEKNPQVPERDRILKGDIELHFIPTEYHLANIFTKPLDEPTFTRLKAELDIHLHIDPLDNISRISRQRSMLNIASSIGVSTESDDTMNEDTPIGVAFAAKEGVTLSVVDMTVEMEKLSSLEDATVLGSFPPLSTPVTTMAGNALGKSLYANVTGKPSGNKLNIHTLFTPRGNGIDVVVSVESIRAISDRFANTTYGLFLGKRVAYHVVANNVRNTWDAMLENGPWFIQNNPLIVKKWHPDENLLKEDVSTIPVWVKLHGVPVTAFSNDGLSDIATKLGTPLMLDSYTSDMCMKSWGRSSYARVMIELGADVELKDKIVMTMPKIKGDGYYTCNVQVEYEWKPSRCAYCKVFGHVHEECPKNIGTGATKNLKNTSQTPKEIPNNSESTNEVSNSNPFEVLTTVDNDVYLGTNGGITNSADKGTNNASSSNTSIGEKIDKIERQICEGKLRFVDDDWNPLVPMGIMESDNEVEVVFDETVNLRISTNSKDGSDKGEASASNPSHWMVLVLPFKPIPPLIFLGEREIASLAGLKVSGRELAGKGVRGESLLAAVIKNDVLHSYKEMEDNVEQLDTA
ncbi:cytokinin dehydrogenase 3-like protein [Tanacetum coccineum]|uniref:Cytokinin dehydrogenase 3-like protein n=1 Tax=Tanacetum coccineum TaxID=301880 RepID=A0ABQ5E629_9ASTR